jgi:hypothetical protein
MMRVIRLWTLALLALAVLMGTVAPALANTEGVPGSRLVFPYIDISGGRETFLMLTNSGPIMHAPVHIQFYAQNCQRSDLAVTLTPQDTAAIEVSTTLPLAALPPVPGNHAQQNIAGIGWADVDVRDLCSASLLGCAGVEYNGLMGEAIIVDVAGGFLFSYPAAPSQGFAAGGFTSKTTIVGGNTVTVPTGQIVSRSAAGAAISWTGAYETYPSTNLIPTFFAEDPCAAGGPAPKGGPALTAYISLVGPADAWRKEAPGQGLGVSTPLVVVDGEAFDGAENGVSINAFAHHVNGRLCTVFPIIHPRTLYHNPPVGFYPDVDVTLGATNAVGWMEFTNTAFSPNSSFPGPAPNPNFSAANGFDTSLRPRGMVGLLFEIQPKTSSPKAKPSDPRGADAVRSWADPASQIDWPCFGSETIDRGEFTVPGGVSPPTIVPGVNTPTCDKEQEPSVAPTWLRDHAQTLNGGGGAGK